MSDYGIFWALYQQTEVSRTGNLLGQPMKEVNFKNHEYAVRLEQLEDKIDSLALVCQALWEVTSERTGITQEEVEAKMQEIDMRDGKKDGKISRSVSQCAKCGRKVAKRRKKCMYCGESNESGELFQKL